MTTEFTEALRYDYPLTPDSVVIDIGAYEGEFSKGIAEKYDCRVFAFEPVKRFFEIAARTLAPFPKVKLFPVGIFSASRTQDLFRIKGNMTGLYCDGTETEICKLISLKDAFFDLGLTRVDLLKINCEGSEFAILYNVIEFNLSTMLVNIQVQFHPIIPNAEMRRDYIRSKLLETHELTYDFPWVWENYRLKQ